MNGLVHVLLKKAILIYCNGFAKIGALGMNGLAAVLLEMVILRYYNGPARMGVRGIKNFVFTSLKMGVSLKWPNGYAAVFNSRSF
jgi:hypothetical protein